MGNRNGALWPQSYSPLSLNSFLSLYVEQKMNLCYHWIVLRCFCMSKDWDQASQKQIELWNKIGRLVCNSAFKAAVFAGQWRLRFNSCLCSTSAASVSVWFVQSASLWTCDSQGIKLKGLIIINFRTIFQLRCCQVLLRFEQIRLGVLV